MNFRVWQSIQPISTEHPRAGQAGTVQAIDLTKQDEVVVKWDDGVTEAVPVVDIRPLG